MIIGKIVSLRALETADLSAMRDWRNIESFRKNFREHRELNMVAQEKWFSQINQSANDYMFGILESSTKEIIGACGLLYINWISRSADFSFYIGKDEAYIDQKGFADDAAHLLIEYGFKQLNLNKIWMELYEFDKAKIDFFTKKFKFQQDGVLRENAFKDGKYWDSKIISLLRSDWVSSKL